LFHCCRRYRRSYGCCFQPDALSFFLCPPCSLHLLCTFEFVRVRLVDLLSFEFIQHAIDVEQ